VESRVAANGVLKDVIPPPTNAEGYHFSETNDNCVAILLIYGKARVLLTARGQGRARKSVYGERPLH
jgi:hypothetical protein